MELTLENQEEAKRLGREYAWKSAEEGAESLSGEELREVLDEHDQLIIQKQLEVRYKLWREAEALDEIADRLIEKGMAVERVRDLRDDANKLLSLIHI